jgi:hypothetical protein
MSVKEKISTFTPNKYNKFYWWRRFKSRETLHNRMPLYNKIKNGDYEISDYFYQAKWELQLMEEKLSTIANPDERHEAKALCMERHRRLMNDYERDENQIMVALKKDFRITFGVSEEELERYMDDCNGDLMDLYNIVKQDYVKKRPNKGYLFQD